MSSRIRGLSLSSLGMLPRLACCVLLVALRVASANEAIPQTPAGSTLAAWLEAFNSGDRDQLDGYYKTYDPSKKADDVMGFRSRTGGFDLVSIQRNEPLHIEFLVKERAGPTEAFGELEVINTVPARVTKEALLAIAHGATLMGFTIDAQTRTHVIQGATAQLNGFYVFPEVAKKMELAILARAKRKEYDSGFDMVGKHPK